MNAIREAQAAVRQAVYDDVVATLTQALLDGAVLSMVDVERTLQQAGLATEGSQAMCFAENENIIYWACMSEEFSDVVQQLYTNDRIGIAYCDTLYYDMVGVTLELPVVRSKRAYKRPHWQPIVFMRMSATASRDDEQTTNA